MVSAPEQCAGACLVIRSQNLIPLNSGAYQARDKIADYQICENLFPETNPPETDAPVAVTHYPREGLRPLSAPPSLGLGRGVFALSNGALLAVVSSTVYSIGRNWQWTQVGVIDSTSTPVSVKDNGQTAVLVDGTLGGGYEYTMASGAFAQIVDPTGTFVGSNYVDFSDTFFAFATIGSNQWIVSNPNSVTFNALQVAAKDSKPDPIISFAFNLRVMWLIGAQTTEVWWLSGNVPFPYQEFPNVLIPYGSGAPYSLIQADVELAVNDIVSEAIVKEDNKKIVEINLDDLEYADNIKERISQEWEKVSELFDFNNYGYEIFKRWYVDGRLYYHVMIDINDPRSGIKELRYIDPRKIRKIRPVKRVRKGQIYTNVTDSEFYMYNERGFKGASATGMDNQGLQIAKDSIVHVTSGVVDKDNKIVLGYLHKAIKPLNQLRILEDATVIYRISRAPERRIFSIDVGNLPKMKAEQYVRDIMVKHKNRLIYDATTGNIRDDRKFMTMLEDFWFSSAMNAIPAG